MKIKQSRILFLLSLPMLVSCVGGAPISSSIPSEEFTQESSVSSSEETSISSTESSLSSEESSSSAGISSFSSETTEISSSSSSQQETLELTLNEAREVAASLTSEPNAAGILVSSISVRTIGVCVAILDSTETAQGYGVSKPYKGLFMDETGYMVVAMDSTQYAKIKDYVGKTDSSYAIEGTLSLYKGTGEIIASAMTWRQNQVLDYSQALQSSAVSSTLDEIKTSIAAMPINDKGKGYSRIVKTRLTYVEELVQEILLFTDGEKIIQVHGDSKISNSMSKNHVYDVYAWETLFSYRPGLEKIAFVEAEGETPATLPTGNTMSGTSLYSISYAKDRNMHSNSYENVFYSTCVFEGYASYYIKDNKYFMVLRDTYSSTAYSTYTAALNGKALFVNNSSETNLYSDSDLANSFLYADYALENVKISITFAPYLLNTNHYWMIYAFPETLQIIQ